jgi:hypothetical protein
MKISYYLNEGRKKNLYCRISDGAERVTFSLEYAISTETWNSKKEEIDDEDIYYFTLLDFKKYLNKRYQYLKNEEKTNILSILKNEALAILGDSGIEGIARKMFDDNNEINGLPKYDEFVLAFEKYRNLKKGSYKAETVGTVIHFHTNDNIFEVDSYEGKTAFLRSVIDGRSYDEIYIETKENIWSEIYIDAGIEKHIFLPQMLIEWESYWDKKYQDVKESVGRTDHLDKMKQHSWRKFQIFMECYNDCDDIIKLAYDIDDQDIYPISVLTMLNIFDAETCYSEYCEYEFETSEWESILLNEVDDNSPVLYIRQYEF